jgi:hypothetical protein
MAMMTTGQWSRVIIHLVRNRKKRSLDTIKWRKVQSDKFFKKIMLAVMPVKSVLRSYGGLLLISGHLQTWFIPYSFHINSSVYDKFQEKESISYLKKYEPIGCRDTNTEELLNKNGIKAFFLVVWPWLLANYTNRHKKMEKSYLLIPILLQTGISTHLLVHLSIWLLILGKFGE